MTRREFLESYPTRLQAKVDRGMKAVQGLSEEEINQQPEKGVWSCAQVMEHMLIVHGSYLEALLKLPELPQSDPSAEVRFTFWGRQIVKHGGPDGKMPAPKSMHPPARLEPGTAERWREQSEKFIEVASGWMDRSIESYRIPDPPFPLIKLSLADMLEIIAEHTERHVRQIEERAAKVR